MAESSSLRGTDKVVKIYRRQRVRDRAHGSYRAAQKKKSGENDGTRHERGARCGTWLLNNADEKIDVKKSEATTRSL